ncbi:MAG TPA: PadR family transcriptional regulator [Terriglobales bacterium]|nr:PadR family transcriptional regulator [Terriglobales bacterium]
MSRPTLHPTVPDLVLLSLLAERPRHGYEVNQELERRQARDWAGISRPQIYYSLQKLAAGGLLRVAAPRGAKAAAAGPERRVFATTAAGRAALADALERPEWAEQRDRPAFLTWMALAWQARPGVRRQQIERRRSFLQRELAREQVTLAGVREEVKKEDHEAVWMLRLVIAQIETELAWLGEIVMRPLLVMGCEHAEVGAFDFNLE